MDWVNIYYLGYLIVGIFELIILLFVYFFFCFLKNWVMIILLIVLLSLIYDNLIFFSGKFIGEGELLKNFF